LSAAERFVVDISQAGV